MYRNVDRIRGFSRETLIALAANIESREWRCKYNNNHGIPPEYPRASSTDDVECFYTVGKDFTLKEVHNIFLGMRIISASLLGVLWLKKGNYHMNS